MEYTTHDDVSFDFPVELQDFQASGSSYVCNDLEAQKVRISNLASPVRNTGVVPFTINRLEAIVDGFRNGDAIPPIQIHKHPETEHLVVKDGFHRYYASIAAGFSHIPCREYPNFDINAA